MCTLMYHNVQRAIVLEEPVWAALKKTWTHIARELSRCPRQCQVQTVALLDEA